MFKVGDKVSLSERGIADFVVYGDSKYPIPCIIHRVGGVVTQVVTPLTGDVQVHVRPLLGEGNVFFYERHLIHQGDSPDYFSDEEESTVKEESEEEYTGGSSNYYKVFVKNPTTMEDAYWAECNDIIEALGMDFAEGNAFKAIWRRCAARRGVRKKGYDNGLYDAEKVVFFGERMVVSSKEEND